MSKQRDQEKASFWRAAIDLHGGSGMSVKRFCQSEGLKAHLFYRWRKVLGLSPVQRHLKPASSDSGEIESPSFVPIHLKSPAPSIEVSLPNGVQLKCYDADLPSLVHALLKAC